MIRRAVAYVVLLGVGTGAGAADARAPETFVALEYEVAPADAGCPTEAEFRRGVGRQVGYDPFRSDADKRVSVEITRSAGGLDGRMKWSDAAGRWAGDRRFSSRKADCAELASSMMFSAAVQIQLLASLAPPSSPSPPAAPASPGSGTPAAPAAPADDSTRAPPGPVVSATPPADEDAARPPPPPVPPIEPEPAPVPASPRPVTMGGGVGAGVAVGVGPAPGALARLFVGARRGALSLELGADATLPVSDQQPDGSGFALDTQGAGAVGCVHLRVVAGCVVGRFGRIHARGSGVDAPRSPAGLFSQAGGRLAVGGDVGGRFFAGAHIDGLVMLSAWTVALNGGAVWTTPRFAVLFGIDVGGRFF